MTRWLVRFGYDGAPFAGWARQPGLRTVEGEILRGLVRGGLAPSPEAAALEISSRTDRGVSARANGLAVSSELGGSSLLRALNGIAPEIFFTDATEVPEDFRVRSPNWREYRYYVPPGTIGVERWAEHLPGFLERPIDVRSFARGVPLDRPSWRTLQALELLRDDGGTILRIRATGFLWGMVRKIVRALEMTGRGEIGAEQLRRALSGELRLAIPLAPAYGLLLWEVEFGRAWAFSLRRPTRRQSAHFVGLRAEAAVRGRILSGIFPAAVKDL